MFRLILSWELSPKNILFPPVLYYQVCERATTCPVTSGLVYSDVWSKEGFSMSSLNSTSQWFRKSTRLKERF